jgi:hypothetical protein
MSENKKLITSRTLYLSGEESITVEIGKEADSENIIKYNGQTEDVLDDKLDGEEISDYTYRKLREKYRTYFSQSIENLIFLTGAGASKGIGVKDKTGLLTSEFWAVIEDHLDAEFKEGILDKVCEEAKYDGKNIEELLSKLFLLTNIYDDPSFEFEDNKFRIEDIVKSIEGRIKELCTLTLPNDSPHRDMLRKVSKRKPSLPRVKIFTLNYDLLFEQAANQINATLIDGFSFSYPREFSGRNFDFDIVKRENTKLKKDEDYVERVFHLYKLHGSINWKKIENPTKVVISDEDSDDPLMIYPRSNKYEASYDQPFFEMMSRFQTALRQDNSTLVTIGFSFSDKHIVTAIFEAFNQNPSFNLIIVDPFFSDSENEVLDELVIRAKETKRIVFIGEYFSAFAKALPENQSYNEPIEKRLIFPKKFNTQSKSDSTNIDTKEKPDENPPF